MGKFKKDLPYVMNGKATHRVGFNIMIFPTITKFYDFQNKSKVAQRIHFDCRGFGLLFEFYSASSWHDKIQKRTHMLVFQRTQQIEVLTDRTGLPKFSGPVLTDQDRTFRKKNVIKWCKKTCQSLTYAQCSCMIYF